MFGLTMRRIIAALCSVTLSSCSPLWDQDQLQKLNASPDRLTPEAQADFVPSLPGYGKLGFGMFSG